MLTYDIWCLELDVLAGDALKHVVHLRILLIGPLRSKRRDGERRGENEEMSR